MPESDTVVSAAGAVVLHQQRGHPHVLVVHRPRYDDWSLPKGKLDSGETARAAAVREVEEETGVPVRLGPRLADQVYPVQAGVKLVHWWVGHVVGEHDVAAYVPNAEIGQVRWVRADKAGDVLTHERDLTVLTEALTYARPTVPLVVLRHGKARDKKGWTGADGERPLSEEGTRQAALLPPDLHAYAAERLVSSSSRRCWTTLVPFGDEADLDIEVTDDLSQSEATRESAAKRMQRLVAANVSLVVCGHRPVLPWMFEALHVLPPMLEPAAMAVVHHDRGWIAAVERVNAPIPG